MVTYEQNNEEENYTFIGIITAIYPAGTPLKINEITNNYIKINNNTVDFATHGDYIFKVQNNIVHNTTENNTRMYQIGDKLLYDGTIIEDSTVITFGLMKKYIGIITSIPANNTDYVSIFKY